MGCLNFCQNPFLAEVYKIIFERYNCTMKKKVGIVCGGYSGEAEVSLKSADMIIKNIDKERFDPTLIVISEEKWYAVTPFGESLIDKNDFSFTVENTRVRPDLCFIIIHGTPGEDGKLQGYFDMIGMPYTSGGVMNTSITFNKIFTTRILNKMGFNCASGILIDSVDELDEEAVERQLKMPLFVKPNEGGSSLGVTKVKSIGELRLAVELALSKGGSVLIEEFLAGREVTCGVIATPNGPKALHITEISTRKEFFDFAAKYEYDQTEEITPAQIPAHLYEKCQRISEQIYKLFNCKGVSRIDYKMNGEEFYVIEINTIPGMTAKSLVPQQAEAMGIDKTQLISMIIDTAI